MYNSQDLFDGGLVLDYLKKIKTFLDANPYEVFTFIFTNPDRQSIPGVWKPIFDEAGEIINSSISNFLILTLLLCRHNAFGFHPPFAYNEAL